MDGSQGYKHCSPGQDNAGYMSPPPPYYSPTGSDNDKNFPPAPPYGYQSFYSPQGDFVPSCGGVPAHGMVASTVITNQPAIIINQTPLAHPPPDYLGFSIFTLICCCLPIGIAALVFSVETRDAIAAGNLQEAQRKSILSRNLNIAALVCGLVIIAIVIALNFIIISY